MYAPGTFEEAWKPVWGTETGRIAHSTIEPFPWVFPDWTPPAEQLLPPSFAPGTRSGRKGPLSPEQVKYEWRRLIDLESSIAALGYRPHVFGGVRGHFLVDDAGSGDYVFAVEEGQHRAAVVAARGDSSIVVQAKRLKMPVVCISDVKDPFARMSAKACLDPEFAVLRNQFVAECFGFDSPRL